MLRPALHRKVAAAGPFTLDDVRDNPGSYSYNPVYPAPNRSILFSDNGNDFEGNALNWTLNSASFLTGLDGGLSWPGSGTAARAAPTSNVLCQATDISTLFIYTLNEAWQNYEFMVDFGTSDDSVKANATDQVQWVFNGSRKLMTDGALRTVLGNVRSLGATADASEPHASRLRLFSNAAFYGVSNLALSDFIFRLDYFGSREPGDYHAPSCTMHALIGWNSLLTDQEMIDIMTDPSVLFVQN